jgi:hypothetical protein
MGRKLTLHFWTTERNATKSLWMSPFERLVEAEKRVNIPSECGTSAELHVENMVYYSEAQTRSNRVLADGRIAIFLFS